MCSWNGALYRYLIYPCYFVYSSHYDVDIKTRLRNMGRGMIFGLLCLLIKSLLLFFFATTSTTPTTPTATQQSNSRPGLGRLGLVSLVPGFRLLLRRHWEAAHLKLPFSPLAPDVR